MTGHIGYEAARHRYRGRTPAQTYCLLAGGVLLIAGIAGFLVDSGFQTGDIDGDELLGLEVNGIHNLVHLLSGFLLLAAFPKRGAAKVVALVFGLVYGVVAIIGLADGDDVLGLIPVNTPDNILHIALAAVGVLAAFASDAREPRPPAEENGAPPTTGRRIESTFPVDVRRDRLDAQTGRPR